MKTTLKWLRSLSAGDLVALGFLVGGLAFLVFGSLANVTHTLISSLQPAISGIDTDYDLIAQRSMSAAAWWMVIITAISTTVGGLGLLLIARTLIETRRGAEAALSAARTGEIAVRAFLLVEFAHVSLERGNVRISYKVKNSGTSPAYRVAFRVELIVSAHDGSKRQERSITKSRSDIAAGAERNASADFDAYLAAAASGDDGQLLLETKITLIYSDVFGREHTETSGYGRNVSYFGLDEKKSLYRDVGKGIGWGD